MLGVKSSISQVPSKAQNMQSLPNPFRPPQKFMMSIVSNKTKREISWANLLYLENDTAFSNKPGTAQIVGQYCENVNRNYSTKNTRRDTQTTRKLIAFTIARNQKPYFLKM